MLTCQVLLLNNIYIFSGDADFFLNRDKQIVDLQYLHYFKFTAERLRPGGRSGQQSGPAQPSRTCSGPQEEGEQKGRDICCAFRAFFQNNNFLSFLYLRYNTLKNLN